MTNSDENKEKEEATNIFARDSRSFPSLNALIKYLLTKLIHSTATNLTKTNQMEMNPYKPLMQALKNICRNFK